MIKVSRLLTSRKAQFFILTAVLVGGSLSITMALLSDYGGINYNEVMSSSSFHQYRSIHRTLDERWFSESWRYRRTVVIFERSGRLMDNYPVHLTINTTRLIRQGKLQPDCSDLRLTEDGEEIPYQIAGKSCGRSNTSIWFLTDLEAGAVERDVALYYGNPDITRPRYETDLEVNREAGSIETSLLEAAAAPESSRFAFSRLALQTGDNVIVNGSMLPKGGAGNGFSVEEAGPVFVDVRFDADHIYRFFAFNQFIRWQGPHTLSTGKMPLNGTAYTVFDVWEAGNDTNTKEITPGGTFSGGLSQDSFPYVAMYNNTTGTSMMLLTNTTDISPSINKFDASNQSGTARMGLSSQTGGVTVSHLDIWLGDGRAPMFVADRHANPPRLLLEQEQRGSFNPSGGWRERVRVAVEERNGSYLVNYPVNASVNLGRLGAFDDCRNIVVVEGGVVRNYTLRERCDSVSFRGPQRFTARWPFDEGFGSFANATVSSFVTRFEGSPTWVPGEHRFALSFDPEDNLDFSGPSINLRNSSFTITLWFRANVHAQDYTEQVNILKYPFDTPSFGLGSYSGEYFLQARYYNETENMTLLNGTPLSNDRVWRHAAMVYNETSENLSLYMNGRLQTFTTAPGLLNLSSNDFTIAEGYSGAIDELKIYKVALTRRELAMQYDERTTLTFLTNVSAVSTETDVAIYGNGTAGLTGDELQSIDASLQPGDEPVGSVVSDPVTYARAIQTVRHHLQQVAGLGPSLTVERQAGCVRFRFETSRLQLRDTIC